MAYIPSAKSLAIGRDLASQLKARGFAGTTLAFSAVSGYEGAPLISVAATVGGTELAVIRIENWGVLAAQVDVLGLPQRVYTPDIAKVALQGAAGDLSGAAATALPVLGEVLTRGVKTELFVGDVADDGEAVITGSPAASFDSLQYPLLATV
jgi:hypothetical protein